MSIQNFVTVSQIVHCLQPSNEEKSESICTVTSFHFNVLENKSIKVGACFEQIY
jgi:hypothetical protein